MDKIVLKAKGGTTMEEKNILEFIEHKKYIQLTKELYEMIRKAAYLKNVSNSEIIRQCCKKQLDIELEAHKEN